MLPILLIHGYSSEGASTSVEEIYGTLPSDLRKEFGADAVVDIDLSRWISLSDGVTIDDVSYAMDRAIKAKGQQLADGFNVVIHSTGALVTRNWIRLFSPKPCPIQNLVHLAGANFGSGLAHIGRGQLARWGRFILHGTGRGIRILDELEFGSWKTIDLHRHFLQPGNDMYHDYQVQEFCLIGSQTPESLRHIPIRYLKEDSSDNTVRTSAGNLNFNYISVTPTDEARQITVRKLRELVAQRLKDETIDSSFYTYDLSQLASQRQAVPFFIAFETAHFGDEIGIVTGSQNRKSILPRIKEALSASYDKSEYNQIVESFESARGETFESAKTLKSSFLEWNKQSQYEGHAQLIFRLRDQFGQGIKDFDITFRSTPLGIRKNKMEGMLEDRHKNKKFPGTMTFYLRTQRYDKRRKSWVDLLDRAAAVRLEITAHEDDSDDIDYIPVNLRLSSKELQAVMQSFRTTIIDVTLMRLPSQKVFALKAAT
ncbi:alpha/beta hydrolase [Pelagicoccus sp. SDUM812003]|uniref:alpha/beta hydrolase n=1 Tax=Pelagicoccus sp. SDUM812003 TaxID=3041267 RepID=UPI00280D7276|nr:alpha/beta hydrolase [Pelagicoccus sp. SDUM812003]MDQ8201375.1 alpha/beta hydrolase [Pelagicoccus sp. SDUM812003]